MKDVIRLLPDYVANQIAAGEVVQRPASVVKELMENAIDARATQIKLIVKDSGKTLIQVIDDGVGMSATDAHKAFERHATSKIKKSEDLFDLHTKGFRGEALASICAVAQVECISKRDTDELGTQIKIEGGEYISQDDTTATKGTAISVKNLFFNVPARRNFLKNDNVEMQHIVNEFNRLALAHPQVAFDFYQNESRIYKLPVGKLKQRIVHILGTKSNEKLIPVSESTDLVTISGFVIKPEFARKNKSEQFFFANRRFIRNAYLNHAVMSAFEGLLKDRHYPSYFLFLEVNPKTIDVNIHPTKTEIKFEDERGVYEILRAAVKHSLGQFQISSEIDFKKDPSLEIPLHYKDHKPREPKIKVNPDYNPFLKNTKDKNYNYKKATSWEALYSDREKQESIFNTSSPIPASTASDPEMEAPRDISPMFQLQKKYIVSTIKSGVVFFNQTRAHQRVLYERFMGLMSGHSLCVQQLVFPVVIQLSKADIQVLKHIRDLLDTMGFNIDFEVDNISVKGIPMQIDTQNISDIIESLIADTQEQLTESTRHIRSQIAKSLAKSLAVKTGDTLHPKSQQKLIDDLFRCEEQQVCPFKKPIFVTFGIDKIERMFAK